MSGLDQAIFAVGLVVSGLCLAFFYSSFAELRRIDEASERRSAAASARQTESR